MHPLLACLCNSRIVQPAHAGEGPAWPVFLMWGGLLAAVAAGAVVWLMRRHRSAGGVTTTERWVSASTFPGGADAGVGDDPGMAPAAGSDPAHDAELPAEAVAREAETVPRR